MKDKRNRLFMITFGGLMIGLCIIIKLASYYFPIAGVMISRLDLYGPFEKMTGLFFGPVVGGIVGALVDLLGFIFTNKTGNAYIPELTITAGLSVAGFALVWKGLKKVKNKALEIMYIIITLSIIVYSVLNIMIIKASLLNSYVQFINSFGNNSVYFTSRGIIIGLIGLIIYIITKIIYNITKFKYLEEKYFKMFLALLIPGLIFSAVNTYILIDKIASLSEMSFTVFLIPRLALQIVETFYEAYIMCVIITIARPLIQKREIYFE